MYVYVCVYVYLCVCVFVCLFVCVSKYMMHILMSVTSSIPCIINGGDM